MTRNHIIDIARGLKDRCENNNMSAIQTINKTLVDDLTVQSAARQDILQVVKWYNIIDFGLQVSGSLTLRMGQILPEYLIKSCN